MKPKKSTPKKTVKKTVTKKVTKKVAKKTTRVRPTRRPASPTIFVQIAAYRDPDLLNTLRDLWEKAAHPNSLHIALAWQHSPYDEWDTLEEFASHHNVKVLDIDYRDAKGVCYARHLLNQEYRGEKYTLQLDSHHRFVQDWDVELIAMLEGLRTKTVPKPLLSSYVPSFDPTNDPAGRLHVPWIMEFDRFSPEGNIHFRPHSIDNFKELESPVPSRFMSGHFIFADGQFVQDVPYDPTYYFHGEEINLSVRAYMAGYDLYAPHRVILWHEYIRSGKKHHWDDHQDWVQLERQSHAHNRAVMGVDGIHTDKLLQGTHRSLSDYERYAGVEFATRRVHTKTLEKQLPPVSNNNQDHRNGLVDFRRVCIDVYKKEFTENDYTFWAVALEDEDGVEIHRADVSAPEATQLLAVPFEQDKFVHIWRDFYHEKTPARWVVWPHSASKGWQNRLTGVFDAK
jgi:hypothetical protein